MSHLPNILTIFRLCLVPLFPLAYFSDQLSNGPLIAVLIYIIAGITDVLDGAIARRYDLISRTGIVLDPLADKFMLVSALATLTHAGILPPIILILVLAKEGLMVFLAMLLYLRRDRFIIPSNRFGKAATAIFFIAVIETILVNLPGLNLFLFSLAILVKIYALTTYIRHYRQNQSE